MSTRGEPSPPPITTVANYDSRMQGARERFSENPALKFILAPDDPHRLHLFLIYFCSLGVAMTEPVESWIYRAGVRCEQIGLANVSRLLKRHSQEEHNHHLLMVNDVRHLVSRWNSVNNSVLKPEEFLTISPSAGVLRYQKLHEDTIAGLAPFNQVAIEYEIERISITYGLHALNSWLKLLGKEIVVGLSFVPDHVQVDVSHTRLNQRMLAQLLHEKPECISDAVQTGEAALLSYAGYLEDCLRMATDKLSVLTSNTH